MSTPERPVVLTVSGTIPPTLAADVAAGRRPRADYQVMAAAFDAELLDHATARRRGGRWWQLVRRLAGDDVGLALACFQMRRRHRVVFTDGEQVGIPYAALSWLAFHRRPRHVMIGHLLTPRPKQLAHRVLRLHRRVDDLVVYASAQRDLAVERLGYRPAQVVLSTFMVDTTFWGPDQADPVGPARMQRPLVCAVGLELRDYPTLVEAVRHLDVDVVVAAASPWSKRSDSAAGLDIPTNVEVRSFDQFGLRQLYADASLVVVPLEETDFQAGITTILEAMSMAKPIVCTRTVGQTDTIVDEVTGVYVAPGDVDAMRAAIVDLLADPPRAARLGAAARSWVLEHADIERYAERLAALTRPAAVSA